VSLVARYLEANGLPTVIIGSALDIVEHCGVPRFVFTDLPLGNPVGHPWNRDMQREVVRLAFSTLKTASGPRTTVRAPVKWKDDPDWRERYSRVDAAEQERLLRLGEERRRRFAEMKRR
jgi:D-proline reductase (dithiol) PrdB